MAPRIEPTKQINANRNDLFVAPIHKAISKTSGGIGKKLDSANANKNRANTPQRDSPHESTQSYKRFINQFKLY